MSVIAKSKPHPGFLDRPIGFIFIILAIVVLWTFHLISPSVLMLLAIASLMLMGLNRPVWAMSALIIGQLTITSYMINSPFGPISLHLVLLIIIGLILLRSYRHGQLEVGPKAKFMLIPTILLIVIAIISDFTNSGFDIAYKDFRNLATGLMILSFIPVVVRNTRDLKILCGVTFICMMASSLIGIMQHFNVLGTQYISLVPVPTSLIDRVTGITETGLELSYILSTGLIILLGLFLVKGLNPAISRLAPAFMLILSIALYFTYTRSALIAVVFGLIALALLIKTRIRGELICVVLLLIAGLSILSPISDMSLGGRSKSGQEDSTISRQILWQASLGIISNYPVLGIGNGKFMSISPEYQSSVEPSLLAYEKQNYWSYRTLGNEPPHNDFLDIWVSYGTLALILFIWLFIAMVHNSISSYKISTNRFLKGLSIGLAGAIVVYGVNAFYHNLFATIYLFWILGGLSVATNKLALSRTGKPPGKV